MTSKRPKIRHLGIVHALHLSEYLTRCGIQRGEISNDVFTDNGADVDCMTCLAKRHVTVRFDRVMSPRFSIAAKKGSNE